MMERTLVFFKPSAIERALVGEVLTRFERKGLHIVGLKMMQLTEEILHEHYAHLVDKPFFPRIKEGLLLTPVILCCLEGRGAIDAVRMLAGKTDGAEAKPGTIRGDFCLSKQKNIVHTSDCKESAEAEIKRFFKPEELFVYPQITLPFLYAEDE